MLRCRDAASSGLLDRQFSFVEFTWQLEVVGYNRIRRISWPAA